MAPGLQEGAPTRGWIPSWVTTVHTLSCLSDGELPVASWGPKLCLTNGRRSISIDSFHFYALFPGFALLSYVLLFFLL